MDRKTHWDCIFQTKVSEQLTWHQPHLQSSLDLIQRAAVGLQARLIDVGGGDSTLVDDLLALGFVRPTVLDISTVALQRARERLGGCVAEVEWIEGDITQISLPLAAFDLWHDRAVFHFLTDPTDRQRYVHTVQTALEPGGHLVIATFAQDSPEKCSGLEVVRYSPDSLWRELGKDFQLRNSRAEIHCTPWGGEQRFMYCLFHKETE